MDKAEKLFNKLAGSYQLEPGQVQNNYMAGQDPKKLKHQMAESGKKVENNKMVVDPRTEDKHERKPDADAARQKKEAAVENLMKA